MTSWWGTRDTGFYTRNNRKSSHCTGALPLIDSQLNVWLVTNNRLAVARAAHCEVGELVTDAMANWFVIECVWSLSSPFTLFSPLYPLGSFPETKPPFFLLHCYKVALQCSSCLKVHLCVDQMRAGSNRRPLPAVCVACTFLEGTGIWLPPSPYHFDLSAFVSVSVAHGLEYWTLFILVVAGSSRRAMADNSWSDWLCCLSVKSAWCGYCQRSISSSWEEISPGLMYLM